MKTTLNAVTQQCGMSFTSQVNRREEEEGRGGEGEGGNEPFL